MKNPILLLATKTTVMTEGSQCLVLFHKQTNKAQYYLVYLLSYTRSSEDSKANVITGTAFSCLTHKGSVANRGSKYYCKSKGDIPRKGLQTLVRYMEFYCRVGNTEADKRKTCDLCHCLFTCRSN